MANYFEQTDFVSNSDLSAFRDMMNLTEERDLAAAYAFGHLVEAHIQEEDLTAFSAANADHQKAILMKQAFDADPGLRLILDKSQKQHEVYRRKFPVEWEGDVIEMQTRCKFDFLLWVQKMGADLKSTSCTSYNSFVASIFLFGYDRQAAWYMDHKGLDQFMIIGVSKNKNRRGVHEIFKFVIQRDDEVYNGGKRKYSFLAYRYYFSIYNLNL